MFSCFHFSVLRNSLYTHTHLHVNLAGVKSAVDMRPSQRRVLGIDFPSQISALRKSVEMFNLSLIVCSLIQLCYRQTQLKSSQVHWPSLIFHNTAGFCCNSGSNKLFSWGSGWRNPLCSVSVNDSPISITASVCVCVWMCVWVWA